MVTHADETPKTANLTVDGRTVELPILPSTEGRSSIDVSKLMRETGHTTLDYGFVNTAATRSAITYIDGDAGILRYRGYRIEGLAEQKSFLDEIGRASCRERV